MSLAVSAGGVVPQNWSGALPADFLPAPLESARVFKGEDGWIRLQFSDSQAAGPASFEAVRTAADFPAGTVLLKPLGRRISFSAAAPFGLDVHWLKEVAEGLLRGATGVRVHSAGTVTLRGEWESEWLAAAAREEAAGEAGLRVVVAREAKRGASAEAEGAWELRAQAGLLTNPQEVATALLGVHPLNQVRGLLRDLGSRRVEDFVARAGSTLRAFDAVRAFWQRMGSRAEAGFWELVKRVEDWEKFASFIRSVGGAGDHPEISAETLSELTAAELPGVLAPLAVFTLQELAGDGKPQTGLSETARELARLLGKEGVGALLRALPQAVESGWDGEWVRERLVEVFGEAAQTAGGVLVERWSEMAGRLAGPVALAVERQWRLRLAAGISGRRSEATAADATFRFTEEGLRRAVMVARGDLSPLFEGGPWLLKMRRAVLTETAAQRFFVEMHVPPLRARRKQRDLESLASAEARTTEDGRLQLVYSARAADVITTDMHAQTAMVFSAALSACDGEARRDHFTLSFTDRRHLDPATPPEAYLRVLEAYGLRDVRLPAEECTAVLHLRLPGTYAEAWMRTPPPGAPEYLPAMGRAVHAVQAMAREWLPALYLAGIEAYTRPSAVHPLLAWSCSPPCPGPRKKDLSYDFMDPKAVDEVLQASAAGMRERLAAIWQFLMAAGRKQAAAYYEPADTRYILANVRRQQRNFVSLLTADAFLVEAVLNVADCAREVDRLARVAPKAAVKEMMRFTREMAETFHRKLRRLYAGDEFPALGPLFFLAATRALAGSQGGEPEVAAVLTVEWSGGRASHANEAARKLL